MGPPGSSVLRKRPFEAFRCEGRGNVVEQLDSMGAFVVPIKSGVVDAQALEECLVSLNQGKTNWFSSMVRKVLSDAYLQDVLMKKKGVGVGFNKLVLDEQIRRWLEMDVLVQAKLIKDIVQAFDPGTSEGQAKLMISDERKRWAGEVGRERRLSELVRMAATHAKQGGTSMALANMKHAWTDAGAGLWFHLIPDIGLKISMFVADLLDRELGVRTHLHSHFPHLIYKPQDGSALACHHDQMQPTTLLATLTAFLADENEEATTTEWTKRHGVQLLSHIVNEGGSTYVIGPMTPRRLLAVMKAMHANESDSWFKSQDEYNKFWSSSAGPYFYKYDSPNALQLMTQAVRDELGPDAEEMRVVPLDFRDSVDPSLVDSPILVGFPVGFLHGSLKTGGTETRITVTLPLSILPAPSQTPTEAQRDCAEWLRAVAAVSQVDASADQVDAAVRHILNRTQPFADGKSHMNPSAVLDLLLHPELAAERRARGLEQGIERGWFYELGPSSATVDNFLRRLLPRPTLSDDSRGESASGAGSSEQHADGAGAPRDDTVSSLVTVAYGSQAEHYGPVHLQLTDERRTKALEEMLEKGDDLRLLNVHSLWAVLLAAGWKTVENRSNKVTTVPNTQSGEWVLIVASKPPPTKEELRFFAKDADEAGVSHIYEMITRHFGTEGGEPWPSQRVVGAVHFHEVYDPTRAIDVDLPWHHHPDAAWKVDAAIWFRHQPPSGNGVISMHGLSTKGEAVKKAVREALEFELRVLEYLYRS